MPTPSLGSNESQSMFNDSEMSVSESVIFYQEEVESDVDQTLDVEIAESVLCSNDYEVVPLPSNNNFQGKLSSAQNMIDELPFPTFIKEMAELATNTELNSPQGDYEIVTAILINQSDNFTNTLVDEDVQGQCDSKCNAIEKACETVLGYSNTDVDEYIYSQSTRPRSLLSYLCRSLTKVCCKTPPSVSKDKKPGEQLVPKPSKEMEMEKHSVCVPFSNALSHEVQHEIFRHERLNSSVIREMVNIRAFREGLLHFRVIGQHKFFDPGIKLIQLVCPTLEDKGDFRGWEGKHLITTMIMTYRACIFKGELNGKYFHLSLVANPSHLEAINIVVAGKTRAKQCYANDVGRTKNLAMLIHGDGETIHEILDKVYEASKNHLTNKGGFVVNLLLGFKPPKQFSTFATLLVENNHVQLSYEDVERTTSRIMNEVKDEEDYAEIHMPPRADILMNLQVKLFQIFSANIDRVAIIILIFDPGGNDLLVVAVKTVAFDPANKDAIRSWVIIFYNRNLFPSSVAGLSYKLPLATFRYFKENLRVAITIYDLMLNQVYLKLDGLYAQVCSLFLLQSTMAKHTLEVKGDGVGIDTH